jgi:hypothetical protein
MSAEGLGLRQPNGVPMAGPAGAGAAVAGISMKDMMAPAPAAAAPMQKQALRMSASRPGSAEKSKKADTGSFEPLRKEMAPQPAEDDYADAPDAEEAEGAEELDRSISTRDDRARSKEGKRAAEPPAPPPPAPSTPRKRESLVDFAKRLLKPKPVAAPEAQKTPPADKEHEEPAPKGGKAPRRLRGKVRRQGKRLIIEIDVTSAIKWAPSGEARLELSSGAFVKAPVVKALTTADGEIALGLTITLVLEVDERVGEPATVILMNGGEVLEIVL